MRPGLEQKARQLVAKTKRMTGTPDKYAFGIGVYWNLCDEVEEFLEELLECEPAADSKPMAAGHNNPLYETENTV